MSAVMWGNGLCVQRPDARRPGMTGFLSSCWTSPDLSPVRTYHWGVMRLRKMNLKNIVAFRERYLQIILCWIQ